MKMKAYSTEATLVFWVSAISTAVIIGCCCWLVVTGAAKASDDLTALMCFRADGRPTIGHDWVDCHRVHYRDDICLKGHLIWRC
jgi:hypothetical protein